MVTSQELLRVLLAPLIVSAIIGLFAFWRRWAAAIPIAMGAGFITGYALLGVPQLPPQDGTDWLFWLAPPLAIVAAAATLFPRPWRWPAGLAAGVVALIITRPLVPTGVAWAPALGFAAAAGMLGAAYVAMAIVAERQVTALAVGLAMSFTLGAAAVVVMSSNLRIVGLYGIAAAASAGTAAMFCGPWRPGQVRYRTAVAPGLSIVAAGLLAGLFAAGRFYPDPGVTGFNLLVICMAPLLLLVGAALPLRRTSVRALIGLALVLGALAAVTVPTAIAAKHAAEDDPYGAAG